jgi:hypothetical protein
MPLGASLIDNRLECKGGHLAAEPEGLIVEDSEGLLNKNKFSSLLFLILFLLSGFPAPAVQTETFIVARVVDDDTIFIRDSEGQLVLSYIY